MRDAMFPIRTGPSFKEFLPSWKQKAIYNHSL
jgi:hypothetical protein